MTSINVRDIILEKLRDELKDMYTGLENMRANFLSSENEESRKWILQEAAKKYQDITLKMQEYFWATRHLPEFIPYEVELRDGEILPEDLIVRAQFEKGVMHPDCKKTLGLPTKE